MSESVFKDWHISFTVNIIVSMFFIVVTVIILFSQKQVVDRVNISTSQQTKILENQSNSLKNQTLMLKNQTEMVLNQTKLVENQIRQEVDYRALKAENKVFMDRMKAK